MRVIHHSVWTLAVVALAAAPAAAQGRRDARSLEESIERTVEAAAELAAENIERWAEYIERNAERWAEEIERNAERLAASIEARVEAAEQISDRERELRERQRELERQQRELQREIEEAQRETQREQQERQREQQQRQREQQREQQERQREQQRGQADRRQEFTEPFSRTVRLGRNGIVEVETIAGDITVTGGGGSDVRIDAVKRIHNTSEAEARSLLSQVRVDVTEGAGRVDIRAAFPPLRRNSGGTVDYTLTVPADAGLRLKTTSGDIRITNVNGELRTESVSGDLQITGAAGTIISSVVSGDLVIRDGRSRSVRLNSVSGDILVAGVEAERADIGTINGDIDYTGRLARSGRYELHTHNGEIRVVPDAPAGFQMDATSFGGNIVSQYQLTTGPDGGTGTGTGVGRAFNRTNRQVRGTFGDAGAALVLRTFNGDITIVRR